MDEMTDIQALRRRCSRLERYSWERILHNYLCEFPDEIRFKIESNDLLKDFLKSVSNIADITFLYNHPFDPPIVLDKTRSRLYYMLNDNTDVGLFISYRHGDNKITLADVAIVESPSTHKTYVTIKGQHSITLFIDSKNQSTLDYTCTPKQTIQSNIYS